MNPFLAFLTNKKKPYVDLRAVPMARPPACDLSQYTAQKVGVFFFCKPAEWQVLQYQVV